MAVETIAKEVKRKVANYNPEHREGTIARVIEEQTAKLPSDTFLWAGVTCMAASLALKLLKKDHIALFIGQWTAPLLLFGIYNKIVKLEGHDAQNSK
jgi:hypothetical protein